MCNGAQRPQGKINETKETERQRKRRALRPRARTTKEALQDRRLHRKTKLTTTACKIENRAVVMATAACAGSDETAGHDLPVERRDRNVLKCIL